MKFARSKLFSLTLYPWLIAAGLAAAPVRADGPGKPPHMGPTPAKASEEKDKPDFPKFEEVCKDFEQVKPGDLDESGFLTLWYNKKTDQLFAQIPTGLVGQRFLIASSVSGGPFATGFQLDHWLAYLERVDKNLVLMFVDPRYAADDAAQVSDVVKRSYTDEIKQTVSIRTMKGSDPVVDLGELFKGDFCGIASFGGVSVNPMLGKWASWKSFKENVELGIDMAISERDRSGGPADTRRMRMHYSLSSLPKTDYKPRLADDRVGYFMTVRYDWGKKYDSKTLFNRYVNRWNLQKRDPSLDVSPPINPIVWYVEKTVPIRWRRYVVAGISEWNKAFEKCGFINAVQVLQQEDDAAHYGRLDPEDVRYNFFRWIVTGAGFAMGPSRNHPLTGEIFDADIVFDDSMVRSYVMEYERMTGNTEQWRSFNPYMESFFRGHPEWRFHSAWSRLMPDVHETTTPYEGLRMKLMQRMADRGRPLCEYAAGMGQEMAMARIAMEAQGLSPRKNEEFLGQIVKEIVMHEVGHCLGLRHNFKASTWKSMDDVASSNDPNEASVGSVMDYNPPIVSQRGQTQGSYTTRSIGPYDYWAIEYGYRNPGKDDKGEDEMLKKIAGRSADEGLAYATDEDTMWVLSPDPLSNRFDMGKDPMAFSKRQFQLADSLLKDVVKWAVKDGDSYNRLRRTFRRLLFEKAISADYVARFPGGQYIHRDHRGDPKERPAIVPVDAKTARQAMDFIEKNVFGADAFKFPASLLNTLAPGRFWHWNSDEFDFQEEFNIHDFAAAAQSDCLFTLLNPFTINRIQDAEVKYPDGSEAYTLAEHMLGLTHSIWSELDARPSTENGPAFINSFRRNLQRMHLHYMLLYVLARDGSGYPADAVSLSRMAVSGLSEKIGKLPLDQVDPASRAHLMDTKKRIDRALDAQYTIGGRESPTVIMDGMGRPGSAGEGVDVLPRR